MSKKQFYLLEPTGKKWGLFSKSWHWLDIKVNDSHIEHWISGLKVLEYNSCVDSKLPFINTENQTVLPVKVSLEKGEMIFRNVKYT
jgi:hypothetical protein